MLPVSVPFLLKTHILWFVEVVLVLSIRNRLCCCELAVTCKQYSVVPSVIATPSEKVPLPVTATPPAVVAIFLLPSYLREESPSLLNAANVSPYAVFKDILVPLVINCSSP